jgi:hypothetical protein
MQGVLLRAKAGTPREDLLEDALSYVAPRSWEVMLTRFLSGMRLD